MSTFPQRSYNMISLDRLAQPDIAPRPPRFQHVELAEHEPQAVAVFHHLGKGTLGHPQRLQRAQLSAVLSPLCLPLPPTLAAESLPTSCYNPPPNPLPPGA